MNEGYYPRFKYSGKLNNAVVKNFGHPNESFEWQEPLEFKDEPCMLVAEHEELTAKLITAIENMRAALEHMVAMSHSWLITEETGKVLSQTHKEYRDQATRVLAEVDELLK